ncbi:unnamed protein product [Moneuplotes crassus]|uniref:Uncharacterized protein n=1 Tax=Euplotes crassus TaxID=5936 RepID=A0AAD2D8M4_EUPCR|nr:unnamed protein product [Moneuplotes crassus]
MEPIPQTIHQLQEAIQTLTKAKKNYDTANWLKRLKYLEISTEEITKNISQISQKMALLGSKSTLLAFETQVLKKVDAKLEKVYGQVQEMAFDQQSFNSMIKSTQDHISEPIKIEVRNMRKETESVHRELERTMNANREILTRMEKFRTQNTHRRRSMCQTIIDNRKHVSTSNRSSRGKKKLFSKILNLNLPTNRHRNIRSKCSSLM